MADNLHLWLAAFVFLMLLIGVTLTVLEFRRGLRESEAPYNRDGAGKQPAAADKRRSGSPVSDK